MWAHSTNIYLQKFLLKIGRSLLGLNVLDLGTGTGTSALFAAKEGAHSVGVEISSSAIEIAKDNAKNLGLDVKFIVGDVLELDLKSHFDLVIDSTILHCIVGSQDRERFFHSVKRHMRPGSYFLVNTMIASGDITEGYLRRN